MLQRAEQVMEILNKEVKWIKIGIINQIKWEIKLL